jgi:hypothetical protein
MNESFERCRLYFNDKLFDEIDICIIHINDECVQHAMKDDEYVNEHMTHS